MQLKGMGIQFLIRGRSGRVWLNILCRVGWWYFCFPATKYLAESVAVFWKYSASVSCSLGTWAVSLRTATTDQVFCGT